MTANNSPIIRVSRTLDIVVFTDNEINIVSNGNAAKIAFIANDGKAQIVFENASHKQVIAEGSTFPMAKTFSTLVSDLIDRTKDRGLLSKATKHPRGLIGVVLLVAILIVPVYFLNLSNKSSTTPPVSELSVPGAGSIPDAAQVGQMIEEMSKRRAKLASEQPMKEGTGKVAAPTETFSIPAELPPLTEEKPAEEKQSRSEPIQPHEGVQTAKTKALEPKQPTEGKTAQNAAAAPEGTPKTAAKTEDQGKAAAAKVDDAAVVAAMEEPMPKVNQDAINKAINKMVSNGMTSDEALKLLTMLQDIGSKGDQVTPEMLAGIPHEVAQVLFDAGIIEKTGDKAEASEGTPYRIIRLPETVMDSHRGKDGIADIPERNSWASTGNFVSLPLPGGGDIKSPETMKEFGLQP